MHTATALPWRCCCLPPRSSWCLQLSVRAHYARLLEVRCNDSTPGVDFFKPAALLDCPRLSAAGFLMVASAAPGRGIDVQLPEARRGWPRAAYLIVIKYAGAEFVFESGTGRNRPA